MDEEHERRAGGAVCGDGRGEFELAPRRLTPERPWLPSASQKLTSFSTPPHTDPQAVRAPHLRPQQRGNFLRQGRSLLPPDGRHPERVGAQVSAARLREQMDLADPVLSAYSCKSKLAHLLRRQLVSTLELIPSPSPPQSSTRHSLPLQS